jgi:uncharacterized membrane protein YoaK (UPF0700 family)
MHESSPAQAAPAAVLWQHHRALLVGLTAAAGWLDSLAWIYLGKVFISFMSGNLLFLGIATGEARGDLLARAAAALAAFMLGSVAGARLTGSRLVPGAGALPMVRTLRVEAVLLAVFAVLWLLGGHPTEQSAVSFALIVVGAVAMGMQAAVAIAWHVPNVATVAMTATLAQLGALVGWREREGASAGAGVAPASSLMIGLILTYLVAAVVVASLPESAALAFGPAALVVAALLIDARSTIAAAPHPSPS